MACDGSWIGFSTVTSDLLVACQHPKLVTLVARDSMKRVLPTRSLDAVAENRPKEPKSVYAALAELQVEERRIDYGISERIKEVRERHDMRQEDRWWR